MLQKSRVLQIQGVKGAAEVILPQTLDNCGDAVPSAFPKGNNMAAFH